MEMIVTAKIEYEKVIKPVYGQSVITLGEYEFGSAYKISKIFESDRFVDLKRDTGYYKEQYSIPFDHICQLVIKLSTPVPNSHIINKEGYFVQHKIETIYLDEDDYEYVAHHNLVGRTVNLIIEEQLCGDGLEKRDCKIAHENRCGCAKTWDKVAHVLKINEIFGHIPIEHTEAIKHILETHTKTAFEAGERRGEEKSRYANVNYFCNFMSNSHKDWFDEVFSKIVSDIKNIRENIAKLAS